MNDFIQIITIIPTLLIRSSIIFFYVLESTFINSSNSSDPANTMGEEDLTCQY